MSRWRDAIGRRIARTGVHLLGNLGVLVAVLLPAVLLPASPAAAHAVLVEAQPADGATLARAPRVVVLRFSEDISARFSTATLIDRSGHPVPGAQIAPGGDHRVLTLGLPALPAATYVVDWRVLAEDDGHTTSGITVFTVGNSARAPGGQVTEPLGTGGGSEPHDVAPRWLSLCLLAGLIGGLAFARVVLPATAHTRRAVLTLAAGAGVLATVAGLAALEVQARRAGDGPGLLFDTHWGRWWLVREAVLGALALLAGALRNPRRPSLTRAYWGGAAVLTVVAVTAEALTGHAAAAAPPRPVAVAVQAGHALAAFVWLGGLASLVVAWLAVRRVPDERAALRAAVRARFAPLAATAVVLVVASGLASGGRELGNGTALVDTAYGRVLLLKGALFLVVAALGVRNAVRPTRTRALVAETAAGVVLLLAAGILVETPPPRTAAPAAVSSVGRSGTVADLVVSLSMTPGRAGTNGVTVLVASGRRPPPAPIGGVTLDLGDGSGPVALPEIAPGRYAGTAELPSAGAVVRAAVAIRRGGARLAVPLTWTVPAPPRAPKPSYRDGLAPAGDMLALTLLGLAVVAWRLAARRARRRAAAPDAGLPAPKILEDVR